MLDYLERGAELNREVKSATPPEILPFRPSDFDTLHAIDQECFPPGVAYTRSELMRFIRHRQAKTWVAHSENKIVGFLVLECEPQKVGHIVTIDVPQNRRRNGVGTALMDTAEASAKSQNLQLIYLETADDNRTAQNFYTARGYAKVD